MTKQFGTAIQVNSHLAWRLVAEQRPVAVKTDATLHLVFERMRDTFSVVKMAIAMRQLYDFVGFFEIIYLRQADSANIVISETLSLFFG